MDESIASLGPSGVRMLQQALELLSEPAIIAERARISNRYFAPFLDELSAPSLSLMDNAIGELAYASMVAVAADDPSQPIVIWFEAPPHVDSGICLPGTRHGFDGADRVYRYVFVDPRNRYELRGKRPNDTASFYFWLEACPSAAPGWGVATRYLDTESLVVDADGSFVVTIDHSPPEGRQNHLQLTEDVNHISMRDTLINWTTEMPTTLSIHTKAIDPDTPSRSSTPLADRAMVEFARHAKTIMSYHRFAIRSIPPNTLGKPFCRALTGRELPWGMVCNGRYALEPHEALVITANAISAGYFGLQLADPWMVSIDYGRLIASLNHSEICRNADGSITWVIAQQDPGLQNWIETGPFLEGTLLLRWELLDCNPDLEMVIRSVNKAKLTELDRYVSPSRSNVTPRERERQRQTRGSSVRRRFAFLTDSNI